MRAQSDLTSVAPRQITRVSRPSEDTRANSIGRSGPSSSHPDMMGNWRGSHTKEPHPTQAIILCLTPSRCDPPIPAHWTHHSLDTNLKAPLLRTQRQLVQFCPRLAPCRIVDANQGEEPPAMSGLDQVKH